MFRAAVRETPFCTEIANDYFSSIFGQVYNGDNSFLSTMRAVLAQRIGDGETVELRFTQSGFRADSLSSATKRDVMMAVTRIIEHANKKYGVDVIACIKEDLR